MNILIIGCGGLGCELIKILAQNSENEFTLVDDDTIDSTNLNRQFLFVKDDVGGSKAEVVKNKIEKLTGCRRVIVIFDRINKFKKLEFYRQFDVVFNCLDNDEARSFVNQRCHASGVKMVDGGSAGWLGQSFYNGKECFDCLPKLKEKVYPVCTVRQRPRNFEHCLVWAKNVVEDKDRESIEIELRAYFDTEEEEIVQSVEREEIKQPVEIKQLEEIMQLEEGEEINQLEEREEIKQPVEIKQLEEIMQLVKNDNMKKIKINEIDESSSESGEIELMEQSDEIKLVDNPPLNSTLNPTDYCDSKIINQLSNSSAESSLKTILNRLETDDPVNLIYDMAVVKAHRFNITPMSSIDSQTFLKKIIPSICTTNSIVASLMILSFYRQENFYLVQGSLGVIKTELNEKRKDCLVCSVPLYLVKFMKNTTFGDFIRNFKAESVVSETGMFDRNSEEILDQFDGDFFICEKNGTKNRILFELEDKIDSNIVIRRIK